MSQAVQKRLAWLLCLLSSLALLVRLTVKDRLPVLDVLYYATPVIVAGGLLGVAGLVWLRLRRPLAGALAILVGTLLSAYWTVSVAGVQEQPHQGAGLRLLFWNVGRGHSGWGGITNALQQTDFDIMGLVEARNSAGFWEALFPGTAVAAPGGGLVLVAKGTVEQVRFNRFGSRSRIATFRVTRDSGSFLVHLVDIEPSILSRRRPLLQEVSRIVTAPSEIPIIVMGDFNTPHDSVWLEGLRSKFVNAHQVASSTPLPTWPSPVPVLAIDHIWVDRRLSVWSARREVGWLSDHARLHTEVSQLMRVSRGPENEALQQTRSALTSIAAALAAERRCSADLLSTDTAGRLGGSVWPIGVRVA